jgi:hypothetical protein
VAHEAAGVILGVEQYPITNRVNLTPLRVFDVLESEPAGQSFEVGFLGVLLHVGYHSCLHGTDSGAVSAAPDRCRNPGHHPALQSGQHGVLG